MKQLVDSFTLRSIRKDSTLVDAPVQQGWLVDEDRKQWTIYKSTFPIEVSLGPVRLELDLLVSAAVRYLGQR